MNTWIITREKDGNRGARRPAVVLALALLVSFVPRPASVQAQDREHPTLASKPAPAVRASTSVEVRPAGTGDDLVWEAYAGMVAAATTCFPSTAPEPERLDLPGSPISQKIRYLSFMAGDPGMSQAVRIAFAVLPAPYDTWNGVQMYVQEPQEYCENAGMSQPVPPATSCSHTVGGLPQTWFWGATLGCDPWWGDWTQYDVVHVFHEGIIPSAVYDIQVVEAGCALSQESSYSDPLRATTSAWGDAVGDCTTIPCGPPDGNKNLQDMTAFVDKWKNKPGNLTKARMDIEGSPAGDHRVPDQAACITDWTYCLGAFLGDTYPGPAFPLPSPPPGCGGASVCGNSTVEAGEQCDDGNTVPGDDCDENCQAEDCGNGSIEGDEACDDGLDNSDVVPDACRTDCTLPSCGDNVIDTGEGCDDGNTTPGDGCDENCQEDPLAGTVNVELRIMGNGPGGSLDPDVTLVDNVMTLPSGGHHIFLEIYMSDWDPTMTGLELKQFQFTIDSAGFSSGLTGALTPWQPACNNASDCEALMGPVGTFMDTFKGGCSLYGLPPNVCAAAFAPGRTDFIFYMTGHAGGIDQSGLDYRYGARPVEDPIESPHTGELYVGTLVLEVPQHASGLFTLDLKHGSQHTFLGDVDNQFILFGGFEPAVINVFTACCLPDESCDPSMDVDDCVAAGGAPIDECAGDANGNNVDDACEAGGCCFEDDSCSFLTVVECLTQAGTPVCACLGIDIDPANGVDDACDPCSAASAPTAEDGGYGSCANDGECPGLSVCRDSACYVPKNRYISFEPNNPDRCVAFEVKLTEEKRCSDTGEICETAGDCPDPPSGQTCENTGCVGTTWWVGAPEAIVHAHGTAWVARLSDTPVYRVWTESVVQVADYQIVPAAVYEVRAIEQACGENPGDFSSAVSLPTTPKPSSGRRWGDLVGAFSGGWLPPDGNVNVFDILAMIDGYRDVAEAPPSSWIDLMVNVPDGLINGVDLLSIVRAYKGYPYLGVSPCGPAPPVFRTVADKPGRDTPTVSCVLVDESGSPLPEIMAGEEWPVYAIVPPGPTEEPTPVDVELFVEEGLAGVSLYELKMVSKSAGGQGGPGKLDCTKIPWERIPGTGTVGPNCDEGISDPDVMINLYHAYPEPPDWLFALEPFDATPTTDCIFGSAVAVMVPGRDSFTTPPYYLATYTLEVTNDTAGSFYNLDILETDEYDTVVTRFYGRDSDGTAPPLDFYRPEPCAELRVAFDCNENLIDDATDINGDPSTSNDCNGNGVPDECEISADSTAEPPVGFDRFFCADECLGCPKTCDEETCVAFCDPDRNDNGIPDECDISDCSGDPGCEDCNGNCILDEYDIILDDGGLCDPEVRGDCSWDCQAVGEPGHGVPDECDSNCNDDSCPDNCESLEGRPLEQGCGDGAPQEDCDGDGTCNVTEISTEDGGDCTEGECSSDCHYHGDPGPVRDLYVGIPDECDRADCAGSVDCNDCDGNDVPDWCDINVGCLDACCADCQPEGEPGYGVPDRCDIDPSDPDEDGFVSIDCQGNLIPDECDLDPGSGGVSCDENTNDIPDECDVLDPQLGLECSSCNPYPYCTTCRGFDVAPGQDDVSMGAAFTIRWLNGDPDTVIAVTSGSESSTSKFVRGAPHEHGDEMDSPVNDDPCMAPRGFPTNELAGDEVHIEITELNLVNGATGAWADIYPDTEPASGEAQGKCWQFPADSFFNVSLMLNTGSKTVHADTPVTLRAELPDFDWDYGQQDYWWRYTASGTDRARAVYANDHSTPGIPVFADNGAQKGYLVRAQLGSDVYASGSEACEMEPGLAGAARLSFAIDGATEGVLITTESVTANRVSEDKDNDEARRTVTVYRALGDAPGAWVDAWNNTNDWVPELMGYMDTGGFVTGDAINSMSYGRDGTGGAGSPVLYFSVDRSSIGADCTDVDREAPVDGEDRHRGSADIYMAPGMPFGTYDAAFVSPPCQGERSNCLALDQTGSGLGPLLSEELGDRGLNDNIIGLELGEYATGFSYFTFNTTVGPLFEQWTTIYVHGLRGSTFGYGELDPFVNLGPGAGNEGILQVNDRIDAIAVSDVSGAVQQPDGYWNNGDEVLFSLSASSPSLTALASLCNSQPCSPADIFRYTEAGVLTRAISAEDLGLLDTDNIDAIDVGAALVIDDDNDCNLNGILDECDIARGFSTDADLNGRPDDCEPAAACKRPAPVLSPSCPEGSLLRGSTVRYLAFEAAEPGRRQAIRVTITDAPPAFAGYIGESLWVGEPFEVCENSGQGPSIPPEDCQPVAGLPDTFMAAELECHDPNALDDQPLFMDWFGTCACGVCAGGLKAGSPCSEDNDCLASLHVFHEVILPSAGLASDSGLFIPAVYTIEVIDAACAMASPGAYADTNAYSDPLPITMSKWGDAVENCTTTPCMPPDGSTGIVDVTAVLDKWKNLPGSVRKVRADIEGSPAGDHRVPDQAINITDVTYCLGAFLGDTYPPPGFPAPSEPPLCP